MEHHRLISYFALRPYVEAKRTIVVLLDLIIPFEGTNADLERYELIDGRPQLLVLFLRCVVLASLLIHIG